MPSLALTPRGHVHFTAADDSPDSSPVLSRTLADAFARVSGHGLLEPGAGQVGTRLPADEILRAVATRLGVDAGEVPPELDRIFATVPAGDDGDGEALAVPSRRELAAMPATRPAASKGR